MSDEKDHRYLRAQFYLGLLTGSLCRPIGEDQRKAIEFFNGLIEEFLADE